MAESQSSGRRLKDWITSFLEYTEGIPSPEIFRLWAGIATLAGSMERRIWVETSQNFLYPNLFVLLVSNPGIGKSQAISRVTDLWLGTKKLKVSPDNMTKPALIDALAGAQQTLILNQVDIVQFHSLQIAASEFGVLVPAHDLDFLSVLNHIFDNPPYYRELRRNRKEEDDITKPQLTIIAGTQPAYLANLLPEAAWGQGFTSRLIMIYSGERVMSPLFPTGGVDNKGRAKLKEDLIHDLTKITSLYSQMAWSPEARALAESFNGSQGILPIPEHSKLEHYNARRILHLIKLTMIASISRSNNLLIEERDVQLAKNWLINAEECMPDIFKEMVGRSDSQIMQDLHFFVWRIYTKEGQRPVHKARLIHFLQTKVPSDKIDKILDIAVRANILDDVVGQGYKPRPKNEHGAE